MIFEDSIKINASPEAAFQFFQKMEDNYLGWHNDHKIFKWVKGTKLEEGNIFYFEEKIGKELLKKEVELTKIIKNEYIEFRPTNKLMRIFIPKMTFIISKESDGIIFTGQVFLKYFGPLAKRINKNQFVAIHNHMKEEGENLKSILEI